MSFSTSVKVGGVWKTMYGVSYKVGGVWKTVSAIYVNVAGAWKQVFGAALSATVSPSSASGTGVGGGTVITNSVTVSPSGGLGPYSHSWAFLSGDSAIYPLSPTNIPLCVWARGTLSGAATFNATWRDTITDSSGQVFQISVPVTINAT